MKQRKRQLMWCCEVQHISERLTSITEVAFADESNFSVHSVTKDRFVGDQESTSSSSARNQQGTTSNLSLYISPWCWTSPGLRNTQGSIMNYMRKVCGKKVAAVNIFQMTNTSLKRIAYIAIEQHQFKHSSLTRRLLPLFGGLDTLWNLNEIGNL